MRVFTVSDLHLDHQENKRWFNDLSAYDYQNDILILAGDLTHELTILAEAFQFLKNRFAQVLFVPGNHDLWVSNNHEYDSMEKFHQINLLAEEYGIITKPFTTNSFSFIPLLGWYDYSFGKPLDELVRRWADYTRCKWPDNFDTGAITHNFVSMNEAFLQAKNKFVISYSHFVPRIDVMPHYIPADRRLLYPVLGSIELEKQIRRLDSKIHVYGHTHVNRKIGRDGTIYINNAFGYPKEKSITRKELFLISEL